MNICAKCCHFTQVSFESSRCAARRKEVTTTRTKTNPVTGHYDIRYTLGDRTSRVKRELYPLCYKKNEDGNCPDYQPNSTTRALSSITSFFSRLFGYS